MRREKKHSMGLWIAGGVALAVAAYELWFKNKVPAGYAEVDVTPGAAVTFPTGSTQDVAGQIAFVLPSGAKGWSGAGRQLGTATASIPLPSSPTAPLLATAVVPGTTILLQYLDASGALQAAGYIFA